MAAKQKRVIEALIGMKVQINADTDLRSLGFTDDDIMTKKQEEGIRRQVYTISAVGICANDLMIGIREWGETKYEWYEHHFHNVR